MNKKVLLIVGGILVVLLCVCLAAVGGIFAISMGATQAPANAAESFMNALKDGNYAKAYDMFDADLKSEVRSASAFEQQITSQNVKPSSWSFNSRNVNNDRADITGTAKFTSGKDGIVELVLFNQSGTWKVAGYRLKAN